MKTSRRPLFVARQNYRARRMRDGARLVPLLGLFLFMLPPMQDWGGENGRLSSQLIYVFGTWCLLILVTSVLARRLSKVSAQVDPQGDDLQ